MSALKALFTRECRIAARLGGGSAVGLIFFLILVTLLPFAIGPDLNLLARVGPALLWISALLATLLGLDRLLQADEEDGSLDLLTMSRTPLELIVAVKCLAHWLMTGVPLIVATPFFGLMLAMEPAPIVRLMASLLVGTPALTLLGMIGAALTATLRKGGLLMASMILPFTIPVLIFGVAAVGEGADRLWPEATPLLALAGLSLLALAGAPFAAAAAIRLTRE